MKQAFASALAGFQGLGSDEFRERPVDRLGALAAIQIVRAEEALGTSLLCSLGVDLIAFKYGHRASSKPDAERLLAQILCWPAWKLRLKPKQRVKIAAWAVQEWAIDICPLCNGAKEIPDHDLKIEGAQPMKLCPTDIGCGGTGKRRYTDLERCDALGEPFSKALFEAHGIIGRAEALANELGVRMLEYGVTRSISEAP